MAIWLMAVVGSRPVPMLLAGSEPDDVAGADFLDRTALALDATTPGGDDQRLAERMGVPGGTGAGLECDDERRRRAPAPAR